MPEVIVVAGLDRNSYEAFTRISGNRLSPDGIVIAQPVRWPGYAWETADQLKEKLVAAIKRFDESTPINVGLLFVDYGDDSSNNLVDSFFPFALPRPILKWEFGDDGQQVINARAQRKFQDAIVHEVKELSSRLATVRSFTAVHNLTPLLLPVRNFQSAKLTAMLGRIFSQGGRADDVEALISQEVAAFKAKHPRVYPPGSNHSCFADDEHFFQSPGRHRHGFFRFTDLEGDHALTCLLNAKCRLGGCYEHTLHFDCLPVRDLRKEYPNCHDEPKPPKKGYVNISPNDFIR